MEKPRDILKIPWIHLSFFLCALFLLFVGGHYYFLNERKEIRIEQQKFLSAISAFTVDEIAKWITERKAEGVFLSTSSDFLELVARIDQHPDDGKIRSRIESWLLPIKKNHEYTEICVYDTTGKLLARVSDSACNDVSFTMKAVTGMFNDFQDFSRVQREKRSGRKYISNLVPIFYQGLKRGYLLFRLDPEKFLFSQIENWPVKRETGENLLVEIRGDTITYLLERPQYRSSPSFLRGGKTDSLTRSVPPEGTLALIEATDYRGKEVLAEVKKIPGTQWSLITKIDQQEVYAPLRKRAIYIVLFLLALVMVILVTGILVWKNQQLQYYRSHFPLQQETARKEERIRFMSALLEEVNDAIITFDKDLVIQSWNKGAERIYGWTSDEVVGKYGGGSLRVDFPGATRETIFKEMEQNGNWKGEIMHKRKDGTTAYLLSSSSHLRDQDGNLLGIITINKDISEVIHSEKSRNAAYRISELTHSTRDAEELYISIHVVIGELMDARNLYIALVEPDKQSISFPYFVDEREVHPPARQMGAGLTEFVLRSGKPLLAKPDDIQYMVDRDMIDLVGEPSVDWLGVPLKIEQETIGVLVIQSYSPKIRYGAREKEILIYVSEQIALTIHRKKIQQELIEAKQKAEVSSKLTSALLANMNHELRTPMNGILGFAEILVEELREETDRKKAENILVSGRRLMDTLDAIMDLSFMESDKVSRRFSPVAVEKIIRSVMTAYDPACKSKKLTVDLFVGTHRNLLGDEQLLRHLIRNLIDNAVKYTEHGGFAIYVNEVIKEDLPMISVSVKDTGIGISAENHRMIFEAFRQVSEGYGRQFEGSGLGLTISKKIVELMHGEIRMQSVIGEGTEFTFIIPAAEESFTASPVDPSEITSPRLHPADQGRLPDILLVEDNLINLQLLGVYIKEFGNVYSAIDGKEAIEMTHQRKFDAILMDINLGPGMDGIQTMFGIRKRPDYQTVPIIAVTGYASIGDRDRLLSIGFTDYLPKPYDKDTVARLMQSLFPGRF